MFTFQPDTFTFTFKPNTVTFSLCFQDELFLLVTDQGFLNESCVWETLANVEGDGDFVDAEFVTFRKPEPSTAAVPNPDVPLGSDQQIDHE